jgi:hypothetical protein
MHTTDTPTMSYFAFDDSAYEKADVIWSMPERWDGGEFYICCHWTANSATTNVAQFGIKVSGQAAGGLWATWLVPGNSEDAHSGTAYGINKSPLVTVTAGDVATAGLVAGQLLGVMVQRNGPSGADTLVGDALLLGISIYYNSNAATDG